MAQQNKTRQVKKTPEQDDSSPMSAKDVSEPDKTLSPNKKSYRALLWIVLTIVIIIVGYKVTLWGLESARDNAREMAFENALKTIGVAIDAVYGGGVQPDLDNVRGIYSAFGDEGFDDITKNCVFRWNALADGWDPSIVVAYGVAAYGPRFELESHEGEISVLLLSGEVKKMRRAELLSILESQPIDTSDQPVTSPQ